jgi:hypothetical protein
MSQEEIRLMMSFIYEKKWFQIELDYPLESTPTLKIKNHGPKDTKEVLLHLNNTDLEDIKQLINKAQSWRMMMKEKAENEAHVIFDMNAPLEVVVTHLLKKYKENKSYAKLIWKYLFELVDFQRDEDYDNEWKLSWFNTLCDIRLKWEFLEVEQEKTSIRSNNNTVDFEDNLYESESDYWNRIADDSDMTLEEYFNSVD